MVARIVSTIGLSVGVCLCVLVLAEVTWQQSVTRVMGAPGAIALAVAAVLLAALSWPEPAGPPAAPAGSRPADPAGRPGRPVRWSWGGTAGTAAGAGLAVGFFVWRSAQGSGWDPSPVAVAAALAAAALAALASLPQRDGAA